MLTKGAIGNLINRYRAVLKKCHLLNTFGSLAVAAMLVMGGAGVAGAALEGSSHVPWPDVKAELDIAYWTDGGDINVFDFNEPGKSIIFGGSLVQAEDFSSVGGPAPDENTYVYIDKTSIIATADQPNDKWIPLQLNAGGTAIGEGAKSSVGTSEIVISGPIKLATRIEEARDENGNLFYKPVYTPIRGGGASMNGGYSNVDTAIITINAAPGMELEVSDILGGGVVVAGGDTGAAYTRNSFININGLTTSNLVQQGEENNTTRIFGGGDMAEVRNVEINLNNCSVSEFRVYGGGYAEEDSRVNTTGSVKINIDGYKLEPHIEGQQDGNMWIENDFSTHKHYGVGDIVGGGYASALEADPEKDIPAMQGRTSVENTEITVRNSTIRSRVFGGGYAEKGGESYVGSAKVTITDGSLIEGNGASGRLDVYGGGYASDGGKTYTETSLLTITGGAEVRGQVFSGGQARGEGSVTGVTNATVIVDNGTISASKRPPDSYRNEELRAGRLSGGIVATNKAIGGVENGTVIFRNSVLEGARILGGSSAQSDAFVEDGTVRILVESGTIKPEYDANTHQLRARNLNTGGDAMGGRSLVHNASLHITGVAEAKDTRQATTIMSNVWAGSMADDCDSENAHTSLAEVENTSVLIDGGLFTMDYGGKSLKISAGGNAYDGGVTKVKNGTLIIDGSSGNLEFDKGYGPDKNGNNASGNGFMILAGGLGETTEGKFKDNSNWSESYVENAKVIIKDIAIEEGRVYTGGEGYSGKSHVTNSDITLDNAKVKFIAPFSTGRSYNDWEPGICSVENSIITLKNGTTIAGKELKDSEGNVTGVRDIEVNAESSIIAVDKSIVEQTGSAKLSGINVTADERILRLLDDVESFDVATLDSWNYAGSPKTSSGNDPNSELTRLDVMGTTDFFTYGKKIIDDTTLGYDIADSDGNVSEHVTRFNTLGGAGEAVVEKLSLSSNTLTLEGGTLHVVGNPSENDKKNTGFIVLTAAQDTDTPSTGSLVVAGGSLKTNSGQIFVNPLEANGKNTDTGGFNGNVAGHITFESGSLILTDKKYNKTYASDALATIRGTSATSTATVIMTGKLMASTSDKGSVDFEGGGDHGDHGSIEIEGDVKPGNGYGDKNHVHVHWKDRLGLLGGESIDSQLITAENGKDIVLEVGGEEQTSATFSLRTGSGEGSTEAEPAKQGVVTLGNEYHASKGTLDGTVIVNEGAQLAVVENGEYIVKNIELNGSGAEANVEGKLNTSSLNSTGGIVDVSGDLSADTMTAQNSALEVSGKLSTGAMQATGSTLKVSGEASSSSLDASGSAVEVSGKLSTGSMTADGGSLNVGAEGSVHAKDISATGGENIAISGALTATGTLDVSGSGSDKQVDIDGTVASGKLVADANTVINVGVIKYKTDAEGKNVLDANGNPIVEESKAGTLVVADGSQLNGACVFLDPAWDTDPSKNIIENASHAVFSGNQVTGRLTAGQNSLLVLGDTDAKAAIAAFHASGRSWQNEAQAAIAIMSPQTITDTGSLLADGRLTTDSDNSKKFAAAKTAVFKAGSMLLVDAAGAASNPSAPALLGNGGQLFVDDGAKLYLHGAKEDQNYNIIDGFDTVDPSNPSQSTVKGWQEEDLILNRKLTGAVTFTSGKLGIFTQKADIAALYPDLLIRNAIDAFDEDSESIHMGLRFLSRATNPTFLNDEEFVGTVNESARTAITAGVQNTALRISDAASNVVLDHMSLARHDGSRAIHSGGVDFWAAPMYGNLYTSGMNVSGDSVRGQFGGLALGADMEAANVYGGKLRVGASINGGGGQSEASGTVTSVQNDYGFGGVNLYAGWKRGAFNVIGSVGYSFGDHEVDMYLPAAMDMGKARADVDTSAVTADLRAEYQLKTGWLDILPHMGVRYTALRTDSHDLTVKGGVLNSTESETQHIVQFPVGVTLSRDFEMAGWNVKPSVDVSFIPAAGDKDATTRVRYSGVDAVDSFDSRVMDSASWAATVGVQMEKGDFSLGLNYGVQASSHETDQNVQLKLGWKF